MKKSRLVVLFTSVMIFMASFSATSQDRSFSRITLHDGMSLEIPSHWQLLSQDARKTIRAAGDSVSNKAGYGDLTGKTTLLAARSTPAPTGAVVRVSATPSNDLTQKSLASFSKDNLTALTRATASGLKAAEAAGGPKIIKVDPVRIDTIDGQRAMAISYLRRSVEKGSEEPWRVMQYKVPVNGRIYEITLSHRLSDEIIWQPILERVKNSIDFK